MERSARRVVMGKKWVQYICIFIALAVLFSCVGMEEKASSEIVDAAVSIEVEPGPEPPAEVPLASASEDESRTADTTRAGKAEKEDAEIEFWDSEEEGEDFSGTESASMSPAPKRTSGTSGLKAGFEDDNRQFNYFVNFLETYGYIDHFEIPVQERIIFEVFDDSGRTIPNAEIVIRSEGQLLCRGVTHADGRFYFYPSEYSFGSDIYQLKVIFGNNEVDREIKRRGPRSVRIDFPQERRLPALIPLDIVFILDTTGSMGEEIERLKATIELIHLNLMNLPINTSVRFGMVLYKDIGDEEYHTRLIELTTDIDEFREQLYTVTADGGGDTPEDLQEALRVSLDTIDWNKNGVRLGFIITDAPPHLDYESAYVYPRAVEAARARGIKYYSVGTGGLDLQGEYILRQIAQYTGGKYIFLTYGETGESEGGSVGSVSHHTGSNYQTDKLEAIIIKFAKEEMSYLTDQPLEIEEPWFEAQKSESENREETLNKLFTRAIGQLVDYSSLMLEEENSLAVLPLVPTGDSLNLNAEYFSTQLLLAVSTSGLFRIAERENLQEILEEMEFQLSGIVDEKDAIEIGAILGADLMLSGKLYSRDTDFEIFLKLLRVETGEILSLTKALVKKELGI
jgi:Mg-chelatase subunit ChlD